MSPAGDLQRDFWINAQRQRFLQTFKAVLVAPVPMVIGHDQQMKTGTVDQFPRIAGGLDR